MTFVSSLAALTDVRGFNIYMIWRPTKRQEQNSTPPQTETMTAKSDVSRQREPWLEARPLKSWVKLSVFSYVFCCLFKSNSAVEPWTHPFWKQITQIGSSSQVSVVKLQKKWNQHLGISYPTKLYRIFRIGKIFDLFWSFQLLIREIFWVNGVFFGAYSAYECLQGNIYLVYSI